MARNKPIRVFVSSSYLDNARRRKLVRDAIENAGMTAVGMERFEACTDTPIDKCLKELATCDLLVLILAWRRGWEPDGHGGKSITEIEYDHAKERLVFQLAGELDPKTADVGEDRWLKQDRQEKFRERIRETKKPFEDDELQMAVFLALQNWSTSSGAQNAAGTPTTMRPPASPPQSSPRAARTRAAQLAKSDATRTMAASTPDRGDSPSPHESGDAEIASFVRRTAESLSEIVLAGFETKVRIPIRLDNLLVPMALQELTHGEHVERLDRPLLHSEGSLDGSNKLALVRAFRFAEERGKRGIAILGHPGSGKTTQLKCLYLWLANAGKARRAAPGTRGARTNSGDAIRRERGTDDARPESSRPSRSSTSSSSSDDMSRDDTSAEQLGLPSGMQPLFIPLRHARGDEQSIEALVDSWRDAVGKSTRHEHSAAQRHATPPPRDLLRRMIASDSLLLLLDGLDEVAHEKARAAVARSIEASLGELKNSRFVVSCRFAGYTPSVALSKEFLPLELLTLDRDQAEEFVRRWYDAVELGLASAAERDAAEAKARANAAELIERLRAPDMRNGRVAELTRNPLLLTNICLVHRDRVEGGREGLPKRRAELYDECVNVLLELWRKSQNMDVSLPAKEARKVLQPLAYWLHSENDRVVASAQAIAPVIEPALKKIRWKGGDAKSFLEAIRDESGLLTGWSDTSFGFLHLTFQEYLAAREVVRLQGKDGAQATVLASKLGDSWWRELSLLALGLDDSTFFEPFVRALLQRPGLLEQPNVDFLRACLRDAAEPAPEPFEELLRRPHERDRRQWDARLAALWMLQELAPERVVPLATHLAHHPDPRISSLFAPTQAPSSAVSARSGIQLVRIPGGSFRMGSSQREITEMKRQRPEYGNWFANEAPVRNVEIRAFELAAHPVTNEQYGRLLSVHPDRPEPERWADPEWNEPSKPVVGITWEDAKAFCSWAGLRLPLEEEWEYACRAGTRSKYSSGDNEADLARVGWYARNSGGCLHAVGEKPASAWGLHDMHGNVWEWCEDTWHESYGVAPIYGLAWADTASDYRVIRGGSFRFSAAFARSAFRFRQLASERQGTLGFRPARSL